MAGYWVEHEYVGIDAHARSSEFFELRASGAAGTPLESWTIVQRLSDPAGDGDWRLTACVDLAVARAEGAPILQLVSIGRFGEELTADR